eukprot:gnl/TRDRNA2_/TRDRNA2_130776_c0_seq1.p1 gnl/TRDRNA2_/TRDRNA2_130776_c0~~gnl/TRDRNA2_/TRDRNA2_130776_c0_seq1.p1  ORF type:complete len:480 (+),score=73.47 gnl/TRDRNA2_/TRDRNA2_130776_c0_seq1:433-1872(+)
MATATSMWNHSGSRGWNTGEDSSWRQERAMQMIHTNYFTYAMSLAIVLNALWIGIETEYHVEHSGADDATWKAFSSFSEYFFVIVFIVEILIRLYAWRLDFFCGASWEVGWNLFDLTLVTLSVVDVCLMKLAGPDTAEELNSVSTIRILKLFRIARVFRLLRFFNELWLLVAGILDAMRTLVWAWVLIFMIIYVAAVFVTRLIGNDEKHKDHVCWDYPGGPRTIDEMFGTILRSGFMLFAVMTTEAWPNIARCTMEFEPFTWIFYVLFLISTSYAMINVIVAVIVEGTMERALNQKEEQDQYQEAQTLEACAHIYEVFTVADSDQDHQLTREEFMNAIQRKDIKRILHSLDIDMRRAETLFDILDYDESGSLDAQEFIEGALRARGKAQAKEILALQCDIRRAEQRYRADLVEYKDGVFSKLEKIDSDIELVHQEIRDMKRMLSRGVTSAAADGRGPEPLPGAQSMSPISHGASKEPLR